LRILDSADVLAAVIRDTPTVRQAFINKYSINYKISRQKSDLRIVHSSQMKSRAGKRAEKAVKTRIYDRKALVRSFAWGNGHLGCSLLGA